MLLRAFEDRDGTFWEVWEAHPVSAERRRLSDRREERRDGSSRRIADPAAAPPAPVEEEGWLVFRSDRERRRQRPIPPAWDKLSDGDLRALLNGARPSGPRSRVNLETS